MNAKAIRLFSLVAGAELLAGAAMRDAKVLSVSTGTFDVQPGNSLECFYTSLTTNRELSVVSYHSHQGTGSHAPHHMTIYYIDTPRPPEHHPCTNAEMSDWHYLGGSTGYPYELPKGLAVKVPAGKQLVLQSHHINTTKTRAIGNDSVDIHLVDPAQVKVYAETFVVSDNEFKVPPHAKGQSVTTCTVPHDLNIAALWGHMHEHGTRYILEVVDAAGRTLQTLYDEAWQPMYTWMPPTKRYSIEQPLRLAAGTRLRQTCRWENPTALPLQLPDEMRLAGSFYFPDRGFLVVVCKPE